MKELILAKLTIAIPTFNRLDQLRSQIDSLCTQSKIDEVEVFISNNGSSDNTSGYLGSLKDKTPFTLRYQSHSENLGFDANILSLYREIQTPYVWFLSDDDRLIPGAIERILEILKDQNPAVIYPNLLDELTKKTQVLDGQLIDISIRPTGHKAVSYTHLTLPTKRIV